MKKVKERMCEQFKSSFDSMQYQALVKSHKFLKPSSRNYELTLPRPKKKSIALKIVKKKEANDSSDEEFLEDDMTLLAKKF